MTTDIREVLEGIVRDMGAVDPKGMTDAELVDWIVKE